MLSAAEIEATLDSLAVSGLTNARASDHARIRRRVATGDYADLHDIEGALVVRRFLDAAGLIWSESFRARLDGLQIEILTPDIFHACAMHGESRPKVVIYRGFLKALAFFLELVATESAIQKRLRRRFWAYQSRRLCTSSRVFSKLPLIFYVAGREADLPRPNSGMNRAHRAELFHKFAGCLSFIVMHELGHIEFGHLSPNLEGPRVTPPLLISPEEINRRKLEEFEADSFVLKGVAPEWSFTARGVCAGVLGFLAFIEGRLPTASTTHPMSVNRLHNALNAFGPAPSDPSPDYAGQFDSVVGKLSATAVGFARRAKARGGTPAWDILESGHEVSGTAIETLQELYRRWVYSEQLGDDAQAGAEAAAWSNWMARLFARPGDVTV
jgi:hypothetical protein